LPNITKILIDGGILTFLICIYLTAVIKYNPRFALKDLPKDIQDAVPSLSKKEKRIAILLSVPFFGLLIAIPFISTQQVEALHEGISFLSLFLHASGILFIVHVLELLIMDLLVYCTLTPKFIIIPGTEGLPGYKNYWHQIRAHLRGLPLIFILGLAIAGVVVIF